MPYPSPVLFPSQSLYLGGVDLPWINLPTPMSIGARETALPLFPGDTGLSAKPCTTFLAIRPDSTEIVIDGD